MTNNDRLSLLEKAVSEAGSQAKVAKQLGYSPTAVNQVLRGTYAGALDTFLAKVEETFSSQNVVCQMLGDITLARCVDERRKPFSTANAMRVKLYRACRKCLNNSDKQDI